MKKGWWVAKVAVLGILAVLVFGWVTMSLWNWLVPVLFSGPVITFWQALGLLILSKILFSGFGKKGGGHGSHWRNHLWRQRWSGMTQEERDRFREKMKDKWCYREPHSETKDSSTSNV